jgi:GT2 family glycosyltransferase
MLRVTVAVPTARRPESLRRLLVAVPAALGGLPADVDVEVLVVDNAAERPVQDLVAAVASDVRYVLEPEPGSAHARNRVLVETEADVVAFLDDDVVPHPGWLDALLVSVREGAVAVGGPVRLDPTAHRPPWLDEAGIGGYLSAHDLGPAARDLAAGEHLLTANAAFRTDALRAVGGFDPRLGPRLGVQLVADDVHVVRELQRAGGRVAWQPAAVVTHDLPAERTARAWLLRRAYLQGRSDWLLDEALLRARRAGGVRVAASWFAREVERRRSEGLSRRDVRFHLATDVARTVGAVRQGLGWRGGRAPTD